MEMTEGARVGDFLFSGSLESNTVALQTLGNCLSEPEEEDDYITWACTGSGEEGGVIAFWEWYDPEDFQRKSTFVPAGYFIIVEATNRPTSPQGEGKVYTEEEFYENSLDLDLEQLDEGYYVNT